jgi:hypothetical protein
MIDKSSSVARLFAGMLAGGLLALPALARSDKAEPPPATEPAPSQARKTSPHRPVKVTYKAKNYYAAAWGIDKLKVVHTASGNLIRFSYRVTNPTQAKALADKSATPYLFGQRSRALLQIPVMEKVGPLRQSGSAKAGQEYWMTFSNKGNLVKPGERVNVIIGSFHADGLVVEGQQSPARGAKQP